MSTTFIVWICEFFKEQIGIDLNNYRDSDTRRYDIDSLLFLNWDSVPIHKRETILKFSAKHKKKFSLNTISPGLKCLAEVRGNRRS